MHPSFYGPCEFLENFSFLQQKTKFSVNNWINWIKKSRLTVNLSKKLKISTRTVGIDRSEPEQGQTQRFRDDDCAGFLSRCGVCRGGGWPTPCGRRRVAEGAVSPLRNQYRCRPGLASPFSLATHAKSYRHTTPRIFLLVVTDIAASSLSAFVAASFLLFSTLFIVSFIRFFFLFSLSIDTLRSEEFNAAWQCRESHCYIWNRVLL